MSTITTNQAIREAVAEKYYAILPASEISLPSELESAKEDFFADYDHLVVDNHMKDGARFRERRLGYFYMLPATGELLALKRSDYLQSTDVNSYMGGVDRKFAPLTDETYANPFLHALLWFDFHQFPVDENHLGDPWEIDVHQVRIIATPNEEGDPTPEGIHQDDDDFISLHLVKRSNAKGGESGIYDLEKNVIEKATLMHPMDSAFVWDTKVMHGVTPITPDDPTQPAIRDMILLGYNRKPELERPTKS